MNLTYEIIVKNGVETGYKILNDGVAWIVQDGFIPPQFKKETMELTAQANIDEIIKNNKAQKEEMTENKKLLKRVQNLEALVLEQGGIING